MAEDDLLVPQSPARGPGDDASGRPWTVQAFEQIKGAIQTDRARFNLLKVLVDGGWHDLTSLWRVAKRQRPIGLVGVGMALNALQASVGRPIFETGATQANLDGDPIDSAWRVRDEYMGILRAVVTEMDGPVSPEQHRNQLSNALDRVQLQRAARSQPGPVQE
ncbi:MAG: hypothetical protein JW839_22445 [Candidatus Lokiarchaeota archaeon]|nr:hypothetical protein [Candidatus Lokiarchaeota archaeon]